MRLLLNLALLVLGVLFTLPTIHAEDFCGTDSNVTLVDPDLLNPQMGNMNYLQFGIRRAWPPKTTKAGRTFHQVRYCFANAQAKELNCKLQEGIKLWSEALRFPSAEAGHSLMFGEVSNGKSGADFKFLMCYLDDYQSFERPGTWNSEVQPDVLAIHVQEGATPQATVGYDVQDSSSGRHLMILPPSVDAKRVAHEFGHVLGMLHEHCRFDRDDYVEYRCENLKGLGGAQLDAVIKEGMSWEAAQDRLCNDKQFAQKYKFIGSAYTKNDKFGDVDFPAMDFGPFDFSSIMLYPTTASANNEKCWTEGNLDLCPLVELQKINGNVVGKLPISPAMAPSVGDVEFIKKWYPWKESPPPSPSPKQGPPAEATPSKQAQAIDSFAIKARSDGDSAIRVHRIEFSAGDITLHKM